MKRFVFVALLNLLAISFSYSAPSTVKIGHLPTISHVSPQLKKSLDILRARIESEAKECIGNARGMNSAGEYNGDFKKIIDTDKVLALRVSGSMICDGVHSSSYQYGVAFEKKSGARIDLNRVYNIAIRKDGHLFIRPELVNVVGASYRTVNESNQSCLARSGWEDDLVNLPVTFLPQPDGFIALYYAAADVSSECFHALRIGPSAFSKFRDANQAYQYGLP